MALMDNPEWISCEQDDEYSAVMLVLTARTKIQAVVITSQEEVMGIAVPAASVPATRIKPRAGPIFRSATGDVPFINVDGSAAGTRQVQILIVARALEEHLYDYDAGQGAKGFDEEGGTWPEARGLLRAYGRAFPEFAAPVAGLAEANGDHEAYETGVEGAEAAAAEEGAGAAGGVGGAAEEDWELEGADDENGQGYLPGPLPFARPARGRGRERGGGGGGGGVATPPEQAHDGNGVRRPLPVYGELDPGVLASARAAGISEKDLGIFDGLVARGRGSMRGRGRGQAAPLPAPVADCVGDAANDPVGRLVTALTEAFEGMPGRRGGRDALDAALLGAGGGGSGEGGIGRRGAAGATAMRRQLREHPEVISAHVDSRLAAAFPSRFLAGDAPQMREYVEHRARLSEHQPTISWMWGVAGARDALRGGRPAEALARLDLLAVAGEQVSIDRGSWLVARELLWEDDPPWHSFAQQRPADPLRAAHSFLADPRWVEVAISRLRELDDWAERRRRLTARPSGYQPTQGYQPTSPQTGQTGGADEVADGPEAGPGRRGRRARGRGGRG